MRKLVLQFHMPEQQPQQSERNDLWKRYNDLGQLPGNAWRKEKLWQELKAAGVEQRFTRTVCKLGYNFYSMHPALRDILFANGLMTWEEWRSGKLLMDLDQWKSYLAEFKMTVDPMGALASAPEPKQGKATSKRSTTA